MNKVGCERIPSLRREISAYSEIRGPGEDGTESYRKAVAIVPVNWASEMIPLLASGIRASRKPEGDLMR